MITFGKLLYLNDSYNYKMMAIDLRKQQALDFDSKAIQQITFTGNLDVNATIFFHQISKIVQSRKFLGRLLGPLMKVDLPFMKKVFTPLAKNVLIRINGSSFSNRCSFF